MKKVSKGITGIGGYMKRIALHFALGLIIPIIVGVLGRLIGFVNSWVIYSGLLGVALGLKEIWYYVADRDKFIGACLVVPIIGAGIGIWIGLFIMG